MNAMSGQPESAEQANDKENRDFGSLPLLLLRRSAAAAAVNASIQVYRYLYPESAGRSAAAARPRSLRLASASPLTS